MPAHKIVNLQKKHLKGISALVQKTPLFKGYGLSGEAAVKLLSQALERPRDHRLIVAMDGSHVTGFAWLMLGGGFGRSAYLRLIAVDPQAQGTGLGRALMSALEKENLKPHGILLLVTANNSGAQAFYENLNYKRVGLLPDYVRKGLDEVVYYKPFKAPETS